MSKVAADFNRTWRGRWIWHELPDLERPGLVTRVEDGSRSPTWCLLRRSIVLDELPDRAPSRLTADSRYIMSVNGTELSRGPVRSHSNRLRYDEVDLAPALTVGANVITVVLRFYGEATPWWAPANTTRHLGAGGFLFEAQFGNLEVVSDSSWRLIRSEAWVQKATPGIGGPPEILDARLLPHGWTRPDYDDSDWARAVELPANHFGFDGNHQPPTLPYGPLLARPIAQLTGDLVAPVGPVAQELEAGTHSLSFDFGKVVSGSVIVEIDSEEGTSFRIGLGEGVETVVGLVETAELLEFTAAAGSTRFESFDTFGLRLITIRVESTEPLTIRSVAVQERLHPRGTGPGFSSSDPLLDKIWAVGRRTLDICSHDSYIDCPTREQRAWVGDAAISQAADMVSNTNWDLARWNIELLASPRSDGMLPMAVGGDFEHLDFTYIPDFACRWINALDHFRRYTADQEIVGRLLPVAENVLRWFARFQGDDGLLSNVTGWVFIDWAAVSTAGRCAALNGLWGRALLDFAATSEWLGDEGRSRWARERHGELSAGFEKFWDESRSLYVDHLLEHGRELPASQHAQAAAVVGGLAPAHRLGQIVELLSGSDRLVDTYWGDQPIGGQTLREGLQIPTWDVAEQIVKAQPGFRSIVHDALVLAGRCDLIPAQCRDWKIMLDRCDTSLSETWTAGTVSHAWSATPTRDLIIYTAGITPAEPGFATVQIAPCLGDLDSVSACSPTPSGLVTVEATADRVVIDSPVPILFDPRWLWGGLEIEMVAGHHVIRPTGRSTSRQ